MQVKKNCLHYLKEVVLVRGHTLMNFRADSLIFKGCFCFSIKLFDNF